MISEAPQVTLASLMCTLSLFVRHMQCVCVCVFMFVYTRCASGSTLHVQMSIFDKILWSLSMYTSLRGHNLGLDSLK